MEPGQGVVLWCQHGDCGVGIDAGSFIDAGAVLVPPLICPACERETIWATTRPFTTSSNDRKFLHSIKIQHEDDED